MANTRRRLANGRPAKLSDETIDNIETALMIGATVRIASLSAGISEDTYYLWQRESRKVMDRLDEELTKQEARNDEIEWAKSRGEEPPEPYKPDFGVTKREAMLVKFFKVIQEAEALGAMEHLNYLRQAAPSNPQISQWILDKRYGYGRPTEIIHKGDPDNPVAYKDVSELSPEERAARIMAIFDAARARVDGDDT